MHMALACAQAAADAGETPVGCVIVDESSGEVVAEGRNGPIGAHDPTAHAEIVALRKAVRARGRAALQGATLLATGEPCALCYRVAAAHGIAAVRFAVDRDTAAAWGFDYRAGYAVDATDRLPLAATARPLPVERGLAPFVRYLDLHRDDFTTHSSPTTT